MSCTHGNLGDRAQNRRLRWSLALLAIGLGLSIWMLRTGVDAPYRALLFIPFFLAAFGAYQGLFRTCSVAARQGVRVTDQGEEAIACRVERARMRAEGRTIVIGSTITAVAVTLLLVLLP